jgi:hypothetical protein
MLKKGCENQRMETIEKHDSFIIQNFNEIDEIDFSMNPMVKIDNRHFETNVLIEITSNIGWKN